MPESPPHAVAKLWSSPTLPRTAGHEASSIPPWHHREATSEHKLNPSGAHGSDLRGVAKITLASGIRGEKQREWRRCSVVPSWSCRHQTAARSNATPHPAAGESPPVHRPRAVTSQIARREVLHAAGGLASGRRPWLLCPHKRTARSPRDTREVRRQRRGLQQRRNSWLGVGARVGLP